MDPQGKMSKVTLVIGCALVLLPLTASHSSVVIRTSCTDQQEASWETYLKEHPQDTERAACLLDYYVQRLSWANLRERRLRLIRWTIMYHPDIRLAGYLANGLYVSTEDKMAYAEMRVLWFEQVNLFPQSPLVLLNAADCLKFTEREAAAAWLERARKLDPRNGEIVRRLSAVYAAAIAGLSDTGPDLMPTALDVSESKSAFARKAFEEVGRDSGLATWTGLELHYWTNYLRRTKLGAVDFDLLGL